MTYHLSVKHVSKLTNGIGWRDQQLSFFKFQGLIPLISNFRDQQCSLSKLQGPTMYLSQQTIVLCFSFGHWQQRKLTSCFFITYLRFFVFLTKEAAKYNRGTKSKIQKLHNTKIYFEIVLKDVKYTLRLRLGCLGSIADSKYFLLLLQLQLLSFVWLPVAFIYIYIYIYIYINTVRNLKKIIVYYVH